MRKRAGWAAALLAAIVLLFLVHRCGRPGRAPVSIVPTPTPEAVAPVAPSTPTVVPAITSQPVPTPTPRPTPRPKKPVAAGPATPASPPPVQLHPELIPKNIEIVRVYYANQITAPSTSIEFDIDGTGFTAEFQRMIEVDSGMDHVSVENLSLVTPNQIHGTLVVGPDAATHVGFPRVLIAHKPVFQAPQPYAVIRQGEVLNLAFTEMGENGRTGRFVVYTNLTPELFQSFSVRPSSPPITVGDLQPQLPFEVGGTINIGGAPGGDYGLEVRLGDKTIWKRDGLIRVVHPNLGQSGLVQRAEPDDPFHRPGDVVKVAIQGSGFQPADIGLLIAEVPGWSSSASSFTYVSPGRLELSLQAPADAAPGPYPLRIRSRNTILLEVPAAVSIVPTDWVRGFRVDPPLTPGGKGTLSLVGRDLTAPFVQSLKIDVDEPGLKIGAFQWKDPGVATAPIAADIHVKPGDYLLKVSRDGRPVSAREGNVIRVVPGH